MIRYSVQARDPIFITDYRFLYFAKDVVKNINKILSGKYSQKLLGHAKQSATDAFKLHQTDKFKIQQT